jgi:predicted DNA-binding transcriptional regulator YafY
LAECVRASKFISQKQEESLLLAIEGLCSEHQVKELQNEVYLVGRSKTSNRWVMGSMLTINQAIRDNLKIGFKYQKYTLSDRSNQVDRRKGAEYVYSPYKLIINEGNYYLLAYDSKSKIMKTFRLDRMREVKMKDEARDGQEVYAQMDMQTYCQQHFGMFAGEKQSITIRFTNNLLDTVIDRFGNEANVFYSKTDDGHFSVTTDIALSYQFYGWLCGFWKQAVITSPPEAVEGFRKYLAEINSKYETE